MYRTFILGMSALVLAVGLSPAVHAQSQPANPPATEPDNTKVNQRDRQKDSPTADQQKEQASDRKLAQEVRRAIVADKSLSTYAHNVKVIVQNGTVTLKGPVRSEDESHAVESKAVDIAGTGNVKNELSVKPEPAKKPKGE
jgi:hyperosmotically inducible protein